MKNNNFDSDIIDCAMNEADILNKNNKLNKSSNTNNNKLNNKIKNKQKY